MSFFFGFSLNKIGRGSASALKKAVYWILSLSPFTNSHTVTNPTATVYLNDDVVADGMTLVVLPDDTPIMDGHSLRTTVASGAALGDELAGDLDLSSGGTVQGTVIDRTVTTFGSTGVGGLTYPFMEVGKRYSITPEFSATSGAATVIL